MRADRWVWLVVAGMGAGLIACGGAEPPAPSEEAALPEGDDAAYPAADASDAAGAGAEVGAAVDVLAFEPAAAGGTLILGANQEPDTLYIHDAGMAASGDVFSALGERPYLTADFDYQPMTLEALPDIGRGDGSAELLTVSVQAGDRYVDPESKEVVTATETVADLPQIVARFRFREGLTWQDGTPVTAADSVFSREVACDPDTPTSKFLCERTVSYEVVDDRTAQWTGLPGYADQTYFVNVYQFLPRHQLGSDGVTRMEDMAAAEIMADEAFTRSPLSFGPFQIVEWVAGERITLERNPHYWRAAEGLPFLDGVTFRYIPDTNAQLLALESGDVDVATRLDFGSSEAIDAAEAEGKLVAHYAEGTYWERLSLNLDPLDDRPPLLACLDVRKAIAYGMDRETMTEVIMKGKTGVAATPADRRHWAYPPEGTLSLIGYDPATAARLLDDIGFSDADGDGVREAQAEITCELVADIEGTVKQRVIPAGTPLELTVSTTEGRVMRQQTTLLFQQQMADIGIKINLEYMPAGVFFDGAPDGAMFTRR
ncbi:MAG: hypothetical protein KDH92_06400, partial [Chloroflexi bacterium]|nr:hypothetical protein [Chloroflexota bacterium]